MAADQQLVSPSIEKNQRTVMIIDPDASPPLTHEETPQFSWGTQLNSEVRLRDNRDLLDSKDDRDIDTTGSFSIAGLYLSTPRVLRPRWEVFAEVKLERETVHKEGKGKTEDGTILDFRRGYLIIRDFIVPSLRLQLGRQRFNDFREWIYDENLDAVRLFYEKDRLEFQFSYSTNLFDPDDSKEEIKNLVLYGIYQAWKEDKAAFYLMNRRGDDPDLHPVSSRISLTFIGVSWKGKSIKNQRYWLDAATVSGHEAGKKVRGYGFDVGWISRFKYHFNPAVTIGYAFGSGDSNPDDNRDKSFRQSGLQDNSAKHRGLIRIEQYGEVFEPELSNLMIGTFGFGFRPTKNGSLDIVYHHFQQVRTENRLRNVRIKPDPNGESRDLGNEVDLILGWAVRKGLNIQAIWGVFFPGAAFPGTDNVFLGKIEIQFLF